jgi:HK97 family phage major capsid protein
MSEGVTTAGGFGVPVDLDPTILLSSDGAINPIRQLATVSTTTTGTWKGVSSEGVTAAFEPELTEVGDGTPELAQPTVKLEKAHAFVPFSIEVGEDYGGLRQELAKLFSDAKDNLEAEMFTGGTASPQPQGLVTGGTITVATGGTAALAVADVYALQEALPPRFQPRAVWLATNAVSNIVHRLVAKGDTSEAPLMSEDRTAILGKTVHEVSTLDATVASADKPLVYGDIASAYRIVDRVGLSVELIAHLFGGNQRPIGARGLYAYWRTGAAVQVPNAVRVLKVT